MSMFLALLVEAGNGTMRELAYFKPEVGAGYYRRDVSFTDDGESSPVVFDQVIGYWPGVTHVALYARRSSPPESPLHTARLPAPLSLAPTDTLVFSGGSLKLDSDVLTLVKPPVVIAGADETFVIPYRDETRIRVVAPGTHPPGRGRYIGVEDTSDVPNGVYSNGVYSNGVYPT